MNFKIEAAVLRKSIAHVRSAVESRNTIPILSNILISARGGKLMLTATDMEVAIVVDVPATVTSDGQCTASAETLHEIAGKLPAGAAAEFDHAGGEADLTIRAGRYHTKLRVLPVEDFPSMSAGVLPHVFSMPAKTLIALIDHTKHAMSNEETRYYLNGIYLHAVGGMMRAVATDGHRLARIEETLPPGAAEMPGVIIPRNTVNELRKLLNTMTGDIEVAMSETRIQFSDRTIMLTSKLIDGTFPEYERVIPRGNDKVMRVGKRDLADAVARVAAISSDRALPVKLAMVHGGLVLSTNNPDGGVATEELDVDYQSDSLEIGFQIRYLNDILGLIPERAEFRFGDGSSPAIVADESDPTALYVLMPMRV